MPEPTTRDYGVVAPADTGLKGAYGQSWAVVIGINYAPPRALKFAVADAAEVARTLITRFGFPPGNVFLVLDNPAALTGDLAAWVEGIKGSLGAYQVRATEKVLGKLLSTTVPRRVTGPDDRVLVYFAGHGKSRIPPGGTPLEARPYLMPADAEPDEWDTHIDLYTVLGEADYLAAKHVFYIFDACCSGLAGLRAADQPTRFETGLLKRRARQCLTAGTGEEYVADRGYEGHSIFTWHLLKALQATAAQNDGMLSATSLIARVVAEVGKDPASRQIPSGFQLTGHKGGEFVFFAGKAPLTLDERVRLARLLVGDVDRLLDEPSSVALGERLWASIRPSLPPDLAAEALRQQARACLIRERAAEAHKLLADAALKDDPDAMLLRGVAHLRSGATKLAAQELAALAGAHPEHPCAGWARLVADAIVRPPGRRVALLVGVDEVPAKGVNTKGCVKDAQELGRLLQDKLGFETHLLANAQATTAAVKDALGRLGAQLQPDDCFVFYFAGSGVLHESEGRTRQTVVYLTHDAVLEDRATLLDDWDIDRAMRACPASDRLCITDGCHLAPPESASPEYRFLSGGTREQLTQEIRVNDEFRGAFTYALIDALEKNPEAPMHAILADVRRALTQSRLQRQTPQYTGSLSATLVPRVGLAREVVDLVERRQPSRFTTDELERFGDWLRRYPAEPLQPARIAVGRALLARSRYAAAAAVLDDPRDADGLAPWLQATLATGRTAQALEHLRALTAAGSADAGFQRLTQTVEELPRIRNAALVVVVGQTPRRNETLPEWATVTGAEPLARQIAAVLVSCCGFSGDAVELLVNPRRDALRAALEGLAGRTSGGTAFFVFVGPGDSSGDSLGSAEAGDTADVSRLALVGGAPGGLGLSSAVFVTKQLERLHELEADAAQQDTRRRPSGLTLLAVPVNNRDLVIRRSTIPPVPDLIAALERVGHPLLSIDAWLAALYRWPGITVLGDSSAPLFAAPALTDALAQVRAIDQASLDEALRLLARLAEDPGFATDALLHAGVIRAALGDRPGALAEIDRAIERRQAIRVAAGVPAGKLAADPGWADAHYHRGRILYDQRRWPDAERELAQAVALDDFNARAHYYRLRAIQRIIEMDLQRQIQTAMRRYQDLGAPLGVDDDLRRFTAQKPR